MADARLFRSRPTDVEAVQWVGLTEADVDDDPAFQAVLAFLGADALEKVRITEVGHGGRQLVLQAGKDGAQGWVPVPVLHWIVALPGDRSDIWPVDDAFFTGKYEEVTEA